MGLARDIARKEYAGAITGPDTGPDRAGGEDRVIERCALQRAPRAFGAREDMPKHSLTRLATMNLAGPRKLLAADAAGQGDATAIAVHDAAITAGKGQ